MYEQLAAVGRTQISLTLALFCCVALLGGCKSQTVLFDSDPQGALVYVDGCRVGRTPVNASYAKPFQMPFPFGPLGGRSSGVVRFVPGAECEAAAAGQPVVTVESTFWKYNGFALDDIFDARSESQRRQGIDRLVRVSLYVHETSTDLPEKP